MGLTKFALKHPRLYFFLIAVIAIGGIYAYIHFPSREDPDFLLRMATIHTLLPGASISKMEKNITDKIEEKLKSIPEIEEVTSTTKNSSSYIKVRLKDKYFHLAPIWQRIRNKLSALKTSLPTGTLGPRLNDEYADIAIATLVLSGKGYTNQELKHEADRLESQLYHIPGIGSVKKYGVEKRRIFLETSNSRLARLGLTPQALIQAIKSQNIFLSTEQVHIAGQRVVIQTTGNIKALHQLENVLIRVPHATELVYLGDIFSVRSGYQEPPTQLVYYDLHPAIAMSLMKQDGTNIVSIGAALKTWIAKAQHQLPLGMHLVFTTFQPDLVAKSKNDFTINLLQTLVVVLICVMLFLGLRTGAIAGCMVPMTILCGLLVMRIFHIEIQRVSIAAMIIALGLLVDNGIVVVEDIKSRFQQAGHIEDAILASSSQLGIPLLTSSLTTILAFIPILFAEHSTGEFVRSLPQVILILLLLSWFFSLTMVPLAAKYFIKKTEASTKRSLWDTLLPIYNNILNMVIRMRGTVLIITLIVIVLSVIALRFVPRQFFPTSNRNEVLVSLVLPYGSTLIPTRKTARRLAKYIVTHKKQLHVRDVTSYLGFAGIRFYISQFMYPPQTNTARLLVNVTDGHMIFATMEKIRQYIKAHLPNARDNVTQLWFGKHEPDMLAITITGPNLDTLKMYSEALQQAFAKIKGTYNIHDDYGNRIIKVIVKINQAKARYAGITSADIQRSISSFYRGLTISKLAHGKLSIPIKVIANPYQRSKLEQLRTLDVYSSLTGKSIPLLQVASFKPTFVIGKIAHLNNQRAITIQAKNERYGAASLYAFIKPTLDHLQLKPDYHLYLDGELKNASESRTSLFSTFPLCLALMFALMLWQFQSFRKTLIVYMTIPCLIVGAVMGLFLLRADLGFMSILGILSLAGIIINNAIILIDAITANLKYGMMQRDAMIQACCRRLRPIIMTTLTTVVGVFPLFLFGGPLWYAMTTVIMFGLLVGTLITLLVVPALYALLFKIPKEKNTLGVSISPKS